MEDIDTHTKVIHNRELAFSYPKDVNYAETPIDSVDLLLGKSNEKPKESFSLDAFLECLDGYILAKGMITIMTTNHVKKIDPACIRNGRMDIHLLLEYCTHYQLDKLYKIIRNACSSNNTLDMRFPQEILNVIPEKKIAACVASTIMLSSKQDPEKILELILNYFTVNKLK